MLGHLPKKRELKQKSAAILQLRHKFCCKREKTSYIETESITCAGNTLLAVR
ncbi:hypothetical protein TRM7615_00956 [Falsiruegeria mediterranea M17]|uniref:Uncharacterized protein n=1 Tax=Falsiruegeria mediterranea M17 TaxID=1200281 RepID=A0A2R8C4Y1_9RHOB|nr:hypothetical protein TRM7615_00956 [Falsiruegeria mediterranea M17]